MWGRVAARWRSNASTSTSATREARAPEKSGSPAHSHTLRRISSFSSVSRASLRARFAFASGDDGEDEGDGFFAVGAVEAVLRGVGVGVGVGVRDVLVVGGVAFFVGVFAGDDARACAFAGAAAARARACERCELSESGEGGMGAMSMGSSERMPTMRPVISTANTTSEAEDGGGSRPSGRGFRGSAIQHSVGPRVRRLLRLLVQKSKYDEELPPRACTPKRFESLSITGMIRKTRHFAAPRLTVDHRGVVALRRRLPQDQTYTYLRLMRCPLFGKSRKDIKVLKRKP